MRCCDVVAGGIVLVPRHGYRSQMLQLVFLSRAVLVALVALDSRESVPVIDAKKNFLIVPMISRPHGRREATHCMRLSTCPLSIQHLNTHLPSTTPQGRRACLTARGMVLAAFSPKVKSVEKKPDGKTVVAHLLSGKRVTGDALLYAMGRLGNTDSLDLQVAEHPEILR